MLKHSLIHPEILRICAQAGHHAKILIADGNYPASSKKGPNAEVVSMNLTPGVITCAQALEALLSAVPLDSIHTMGIPADDPYAKYGEPAAWGEFKKLIRKSGLKLKLKPIMKWDFYAAVESPDHVLTIQTGDAALWANVLLVVGSRPPGKRGK